MSDRLTPWIYGPVEPARAGWYEVKCRHRMFGNPPGERIYWSGRHWFLDDKDTRATAQCSFGRSCCEWRGLSTPGEAP